MPKLISNFHTKFTHTLAGADLTEYQKSVITLRYLSMVSKVSGEHQRAHILYLVFTNLITISSVLVTALVSIKELAWIDQVGSMIIFWLTWSLGISLTLSNKWLYSFNIHKKYVINAVILEKLQTEGWIFLSGVGKYAGLDADQRFAKFCERIEKIKIKSMEPLVESDSSGTARTALTDTPGASTDEKAPAPRPLSRRYKSIRPTRVSLRDNIADGSSGTATEDDGKKDIVLKIPSVVSANTKWSISE